MSTVVDDPTLEAPHAPPAEAPPVAPPSLPTQAPERPDRPLTRDDLMRPAIGVAMTTLGCAFLVGGMFIGVAPRIFAAVGGLIGVASAIWAARARKRPTVVQIISIAIVLIAGVVLLAATDLSALTKITKLVGDAVKNARLRRPPAPFDEGWRALLPWTVGMIGYAAAWVGAVGRKPAVGLLIPIPVIAFAAIAQPAEAQISSGIVAFVTFAIGLAVIYRADRGEGGGVSTAYELKRAARTAPLVIVLIAALIAASRLGFLFPQPVIDPTQRAQLPKAVPLSAVKDRVLFEVSSQVTGPWRVGVLDVFDGASWRLPPYSDTSFKDAPQNGLLGQVFGQDVSAQTHADLTIRGLDGTVLPLPARMNGIVGEHLPKLVTDARTQTVRVKQGQVSDGLKYTAVFGLLPTEADLRKAGKPDPAIVTEFTDMAHQTPPPSVQALLNKAPQDAWDRLDFMRKALYDQFVSAGSGLPGAVPPSKVEDLLAGSHKGTPFEYVAAQAEMARWAGIPARIGYGFDRGEKLGNILTFRPKSGSAWLEVYFQGYGWFPITGLPKKAESTSGKSDQQQNAQILPSDDIEVSLYIPLRVTPTGLLFKQIQAIVLIVLPFVVTAFLLWLFYPVYLKARRRSRRRLWAANSGRKARIAVAYAELRDMATDLGVGDPYVTPLAYVGKVVPDEEHRELAWLVTRCLWGDLKDSITDDEVFAAEELSRSMRRRLFEAQPFTIRGISVVSRLSLRNPYAPELLSPPLAKFEPKKALARLFKRGPKKTKEKMDEAIDVA